MHKGSGGNYFVAYLVPVHVTRFLTPASIDLVLMHAATVSSMQFTHLAPGRIPCGAGIEPAVQIFSVKLTEVKGGFKFPLSVYGVVAARDGVDYNRNLLFSRNRSQAQELKEDVCMLRLSFDFLLETLISHMCPLSLINGMKLMMLAG